MLSRETSSGAGLPFNSPEVGGAGSIDVYALSDQVSRGEKRVYNTHLSPGVGVE